MIKISTENLHLVEKFKTTCLPLFKGRPNGIINQEIPTG